MRNKNNDEPRDEFDRIMIPAFIARPFERLGGRPNPGLPGGRAEDPLSANGQRSPEPVDDPDAPATEAAAEAEQPAPRAWWAGYRGKLLLYGVGTVVMVFLQSRS